MEKSVLGGLYRHDDGADPVETGDWTTGLLNQGKVFDRCVYKRGMDGLASLDCGRRTSLAAVSLELSFPALPVLPDPADPLPGT